MSCGVGHRHGLDPTLLWLWHRLAAVALIRPLAWELPCAVGAVLKKKKKKDGVWPYSTVVLIKDCKRLHIATLTAFIHSQYHL